MTEHGRAMGPTAPTLAAIGAVALLATMAYAATQGYMASQFAAIGSIAWGQVLIVDVYVGFALFAGWIGWREAGRARRATAWIVALLLIGNAVACVYVLMAWWRNGDDAEAFWHGRRRRRG